MHSWQMRERYPHKCGWLWIELRGYQRLPRGIHWTIHELSGYVTGHPQPSTASQQQMPTMWMMAHNLDEKTLTRCPPSIHCILPLSTQLSTGNVVMVGVAWRMRRGPTYAHKGRVVHIFRPVIHAGNELSVALESGAVTTKRWENGGLRNHAYLSTLIVDNFASCG